MKFPYSRRLLGSIEKRTGFSKTKIAMLLNLNPVYISNIAAGRCGFPPAKINGLAPKYVGFNEFEAAAVKDFLISWDEKVLRFRKKSLRGSSHGKNKSKDTGKEQGAKKARPKNKARRNGSGKLQGKAVGSKATRRKS